MARFVTKLTPRIALSPWRAVNLRRPLVELLCKCLFTLFCVYTRHPIEPICPFDNTETANIPKVAMFLFVLFVSRRLNKNSYVLTFQQSEIYFLFSSDSLPVAYSVNLARQLG
ncbi:hypothetical protein Ancab_008796 [Ancistrocladus abbreviatus]